MNNTHSQVIKALAEMLTLASIAGCLVPSSASAQSFDCAKASSQSERAICGDSQLMQLDQDLAGALKSAGRLAPQDKAQLIADERGWLTARDRECRDPDPSECLKGVYRARIAELQNPHSGVGADRTAIASCRAIVDRYRTVADKNPGVPPLKVLTEQEHPLVTLAQDLHGENYVDSVIDWAAKQTPPIVLAPGLIEQLESQYTQRAHLQLQPGTDYYAATADQGTMHCIAATYFTVENGTASVAPAPPGLEESSCMATQSFATVAGRPSILVEQYDWTPSMTASLTLDTWKKDRYTESCSVVLSYAPAFIGNTINDWEGKGGIENEEGCSGNDCPALKNLAFELVSAVQSSPLKAQRKYKALLTPAQLQQYAHIQDDAASVPVTDATDATANIAPADLESNNPLMLPVIYQNRLYRASLGHYSIGWRVFGDWQVRFERIEQEKPVTAGNFSVGMTKGRLLDAAILPLPLERTDSSAR